MPQVIQSDVRQSGPFQDGFEVLVDQAVHIHWPSKFRNKDQVHGLWPFFGINNWICRLKFPQLLQSRENPILQSYDSPTSCTLRLTIFPLTRRPFSQGSFYADGSTLPVNVLPLEPDVLAGAHSSGNGNAKQSPVHRRQRNFQKSFGLLYTEDSHLAPSNPWQLCAFGRNLQDHFPLPCLSERRVEHPMSPLDRSRRKTAI